MSAPKLPLAARKSIRDDFDPYVPTFEKEMQALFGVKWTLEMPWSECLETAEPNSGFTKNPGRFGANYFQEAVSQLKKITKEGKDDMIVEAINETASAHIMTIVLDDNISGFSGCKFEDGKLCIVFKLKDYFGNNVTSTMDKLVSLL